MKVSCNWLGWILHFTFGMLLGAGMGYFFVRGGSRSYPVIEPRYALKWCLGFALLVGAIGAYYGDTLWIGSSYRAIPPDAPRHSLLSRCLSVVLGVLGSTLAGIAWFQNWN